MKTIKTYLSEAKSSKLEKEIDKAITDLWKAYNNLDSIRNMKELKSDKERYKRYSADLAKLDKAIVTFDDNY